MPFDRSQPYNDLPLLPPGVDLETKAVLKQAITANRVLANLRGLAAQIPNQGMLINSIVLQEARLSSEIENIVTTNDELYRADADAEREKDLSRGCKPHLALFEHAEIRVPDEAEPVRDIIGRKRRVRCPEEKDADDQEGPENNDQGHRDLGQDFDPL